MERFKGTGAPVRVLVLRGGAIGDFVVTLPVLQWLRLAAPGAVIDLACHGRVAPLAQDLVTHWRDIESAVFLPLFREEPVAERAINGFLGNYDLIVSFLGTDTLPAKRLRDVLGERAIQIDPLPRDEGRHVTAGFFGQLRAAGLPAPDAEESAHLYPVIEVQEAKRQEARELLGSLGPGSGQAVVAVHPGSGSEKKNTPAEVLGKVWAWLAEAFEEAAPVLVKGEADEAVVGRLLERLEPVAPVLEAPDLGLLAGVLGECALTIGHDSGVSHISAAVGTPTVAVFVSTDSRVWAPRGPRVALAEPTAESIEAAVLSVAGK